MRLDLHPCKFLFIMLSIFSAILCSKCIMCLKSMPAIELTTQTIHSHLLKLFMFIIFNT